MGRGGRRTLLCVVDGNERVESIRLRNGQKVLPASSVRVRNVRHEKKLTGMRRERDERGMNRGESFGSDHFRTQPQSLSLSPVSLSLSPQQQLTKLHHEYVHLLHSAETQLITALQQAQHQLSRSSSLSLSLSSPPLLTTSYAGTKRPILGQPVSPPSHHRRVRRGGGSVEKGS